MSKKEKLLAKLRRNPKNIRPEELEHVLVRLGFKKRQGRGSHMVYKRGEYRLTVPYKKPFLKPIYIKLALEIIDELGLDPGE
ncbi:MAG: addiction module toxin, HicA family [Aquificales bacterium]|nr:addiction module toxin, HicA family [Aquificales bacterium]